MPATKAATAASEVQGSGQKSKKTSIAKRVFPFLGWFEGYSKTKLRMDFVAGLTVALVLIPQSMAYAQLAGLPAYYGLYAAFLPPAVAALFGSSYQLATGPVAVVSLMTAASLEPLATAGSTAFIAYAVALSLIVGIFQLLLGVLRLGLVVNFLSHPVVNGFTNAAAIIIASSQFSKLFGVYVDGAEHHYETIYRVVVAALQFTHWPTLALAVLAIAIMVGAKKINPKIPGVLIAVVVATVISWAVGFQRNDTVELSRIVAQPVVETIQMFNDAVDRKDAIAKKKVEELVPRKKQIEEAEGTLSKAFVVAEHQVDVAELELTSLNRQIHELREKLRNFHLTAVADEGGATRYHLRSELPPGVKGDGLWRLKVGNTKLKESSMLLMGGGAVVGEIPKGLKFGLPTHDGNGKPIDLLSLIPTLLSAAVIISLLGFMEAISIAKAMAAKTGQRLDPNRELIGQGLANIVGSFAQSYPVSGSFSRSAVNLQAGAPTGLSSVFASCVVLLTLLLFTPLLYHLPQSVLASIIMMAVIGLVNVKGFVHSWKAQRYDGAVSIVAFLCTLGFAPHLDKGIMIGVSLSLGLYLLRNMKPDIAMLSKHPDGSYRNAARHNLPVCKHIAVLRFNGSLFFVNVNYLEEKVLEQIATMPALRHVVIVGNGINELDASGEEMLSMLVGRLRESGYEVSLSGLNDDVLDVLRRTRLYERIGEDHLFRNVASAVEALHGPTHRTAEEEVCPLLQAHIEGLPITPTMKVSVELMHGKWKKPSKAEESKAEGGVSDKSKAEESDAENDKSKAEASQPIEQGESQ
jgi:sulfate permease, SulP family